MFLFFLSLVLLFLSPKVSSQNPNMFDIEIFCYDSSSPGCGNANAMGIYELAGQIVSDNLILNSRIKVHIEVENVGNTKSYGNYAFQLKFIIKLLLIPVLTSTCFECINSLYLRNYSTI